MNGLLLVLVLAATSPQLEKSIDAHVAPFERANAFGGVVFVAKGDKVVFEKAYGMANAEFGIPNKPDTRFAVASITKLFTRAMLVKLFEEKKLSPEDLLAKWVPDFPEAGRITIDHLSKHRSGIRDPEDLRRLIRMSMTTAETVQKIKAHPLGSEPGKEYSYTTANYAVLAHIIERVTGKPFSQVIKEMVYDPAAMRDSGELTTATVVPRLASGYMPDPFSGALSVCGPEDPSWKAGGGSSYSTARDLHRFVRAYYSNRFFATRDFPSVFGEGTTHEKRSLRASGSFPGAGANLIHFPDDDVTVVVLSNNYATVAGLIAQDVSGMMFGIAAEPPVLPKAMTGRIPEANLVGSYTIEGRPWTPSIAIQQGKPVLVWNEIRRSALVRVAEDTWFSPLDWTRLRFTFDADGKVTGGVWLYQKDEPLKMMLAPRESRPSP